MKIVQVSTPDELALCLALRREVFIEEQGVAEDIEIDEYDQLGKAVHMLLQDELGSPVATARFKAWDARTAKVQRVAVKQSVRGQGLGTLMMRAVEDAAREAGYAYTMLDAQSSAQGFYDNLGYVPTSPKRFYEAGIEHIRMSKGLRPIEA